MEVASEGEFGQAGEALPVPTGADSKALDISDTGVAVGYFSLTAQEGAVWLPNGGFVVIPSLRGAIWTTALGVNNHLQVVGTRATREAFLGFVWEKGIIRDIDPGRWGYSQAFDISDNGFVAGTLGVNLDSVGFRWLDGRTQELPPFAGGIASQAAAVNDAGIVVGRTFLYLPPWPGAASRPTLWINRVAESLPSEPAYRHTIVRDVNNRGVIVGRAYDHTGTEVRFDALGELWLNGELIHLQTLVDSAAGFTVDDALSINDEGQILVRGNGGQSYVLSPIEPPIADLTGDCAVDSRDIAAFLDQWGRRNSYADLNSDGVVDAIDLGILLGAWSPSR